MENKLDTLIQFYRELLDVFGLAADDKGFIYVKNSNDPVFIEGNRLVLPTNYQQRENTDSARMLFHPLAEDINLGESKIIKALRNQINIRMNYAVAIVGASLLEVIRKDDDHKNLNPEQRQLLTAVGVVNPKASEKWMTLMLAAIKEGSYAHLFLKRGGFVKDPQTGQETKYARVGTISFPYYSKIQNKEVTGMREMDRVPFTQILEFIIPEIAVEGAYSAGSDSRRAPFLDALMKTAQPFMVRINELLDIYEKQIDKEELPKLRFNMNWKGVMDDLENQVGLINTVPAQSEGPVKVAPKSDTVGPQIAAVHTPKQPEYAQPSIATIQAAAKSTPVAAAPVPASSGKMTVADMRAAEAARMATVPVPQHMGMVMPQQQMVQVMTPQGPMLVPQSQLMPQQQQMTYAPGMVMPGMAVQASAYPPNPMMPQTMAPTMMVQQAPAAPVWATPPAEQVLVQTQQGIMSQAIAISMNLPYQIIQQQPQQQQVAVQAGAMMMGSNQPVWAR